MKNPCAPERSGSTRKVPSQPGSSGSANTKPGGGASGTTSSPNSSRACSTCALVVQVENTTRPPGASRRAASASSSRWMPMSGLTLSPCHSLSTEGLRSTVPQPEHGGSSWMRVHVPSARGSDSPGCEQVTALTRFRVNRF
jgi:hypothetical protein